MKTRQVFTFNADPDDDDQGKEATSDDDEDYNPGGYEAVFCLGNNEKKLDDIKSPKAFGDF